jgi:8-oxo-dGTP pyrophosphatase MutT (NUDIX family)
MSNQDISNLYNLIFNEDTIDTINVDTNLDTVNINTINIDTINDNNTLNDDTNDTLHSNTFVNQEHTFNINYNDNTKKKSPSKSKYKNIYCVNCGEKGHVVKDCHGPITSFGIIAFKIVENENDELLDKNLELKDILSYSKSNSDNQSYPKIKFLMIQRKDTMGFTDFVRGKYPEDANEYNKVLPIFLNEMTEKEKQSLLTKSFDDIWKELWVNHDSKCFRNEYDFAYKKFSKLDIPNLINQSKTCFKYTEFGFPKGRRNMKETNIACAEREFYEETGYNKNCYDFIKNYPTIHEEFVGTNGVRYRHIYYLVKIKKDVPPPKIDYKNKIQTGEVQNIGWFSYDECMSLIRHYDIAKKQVIKNVYNNLLEMKNNYVCCNFYYTGKKFFRTSPRKMYYKNNTYQNFTGSKSL